MNAFGQHCHAFTRVSAETARGVETARVVDHDRRLADFRDEIDRRGERT